MATKEAHVQLTKEALKELEEEMDEKNVITHRAVVLSQNDMKTLKQADLPNKSDDIDDRDWVGLKHFTAEGQPHHFMRATNGQSEYEAYQAGLEWIKGETLKATALFINPNPAEESWQAHLGNAIHAVEDSFTPSHAKRSADCPSSGAPTIIGILEFKVGDLIAHHAGDKALLQKKKPVEESPPLIDRENDPTQQQRDTPLNKLQAMREGHLVSNDMDKTPTALGRLAIAAVKELIGVFFATVKQSKKDGISRPTGLMGWNEYVEKWLKVDPELSRLREQPPKSNPSSPHIGLQSQRVK